MRLTNTITFFLLMVGGLSFTEKITFLLGIVALSVAIFVNIHAYRKHKAERKLAEKKLEEYIKIKNER